MNIFSLTKTKLNEKEAYRKVAINQYALWFSWQFKIRKMFAHQTYHNDGKKRTRNRIEKYYFLYPFLGAEKKILRIENIWRCFVRVNINTFVYCSMRAQWKRV